MAFSYRIRQAIATFDRRAPRQRASRATALLSPRERALFDRMLPCDQRHALAVYDAARTAAPDDEPLWKAALLHDVGKGRPSLAERTAKTLIVALAPWIAIRWQRRPVTSLRGRLARQAADTAASARFAELAGSDPAVIEILASYGYREHAGGRLLAELDRTL